VVQGNKIIKKEHSATFKSPVKFPESQHIMEHFSIKDGSRLLIFWNHVGFLNHVFTVRLVWGMILSDQAFS